MWKSEIMEATKLFITFTILSVGIAYTDKNKNVNQKRFFGRCQLWNWNQVIKDNMRGNSVEACVHGNVKKLYEISK